MVILQLVQLFTGHVMLSGEINQLLQLFLHYQFSLLQRRLGFRLQNCRLHVVKRLGYLIQIEVSRFHLSIHIQHHLSYLNSLNIMSACKSTIQWELIFEISPIRESQLLLKLNNSLFNIIQNRGHGSNVEVQLLAISAQIIHFVV